MSKVIHVPKEAHEAAKLHCDHLGQPMSAWVAELILAEVRRIGDDMGGASQQRRCGQPMEVEATAERGPTSQREAESGSDMAASQEQHGAVSVTMDVKANNAKLQNLTPAYAGPPFWAGA